MERSSNTRSLPYVPTDPVDIFYPESDGKPMAETDLHIDEIIRMRHILKAYFAEKPDVYVSGNIMMYYEEGVVHSSVSPDILVSFGIGKKRRRTYKLWEERKPPDFVMEFSSKGTYRDDLEKKVNLYATIGITEYFLYDAERLYLPSSLMAFRLVGGSYVEISQQADGGFFSEILNLTIYVQDESFGVYNPTTAEWLQSAEEKAEIAEAEVARLQEELKRLQNTAKPSS